MKKLSIFMALCIIFPSCTKAVENIPVPEEKYKVPVQIDLRSQRDEIGFGLKKDTNITTVD